MVVGEKLQAMSPNFGPFNGNRLLTSVEKFFDVVRDHHAVRTSQLELAARKVVCPQALKFNGTNLEPGTFKLATIHRSHSKCPLTGFLPA